MGKLNKDNFRKAVYYLKKNGIRNTMYAVAERLQPKETDSYTYEEPAEDVLDRQRKTTWENPVTFSILVPVYHTPAEYFKEMVESVLAQTYPYFQLVLLDAGEEPEPLRSLADGYQDDRVCYYKLDDNKGIAENTNAGISYAIGDYIALLDHDDLLTADALYEFATAIEEGKKQGIDFQMIYSDEDKCDGDGKSFYEPHFKLDFNLDLLMTNNYICHFTAVKADVFKELRLRGEYNGAQDFDLVLRVAGRFMSTPQVICHVSKVLYHWRCHRNSTAANPASKMYAYEAGKRAVESFVAERGWNVLVRHMKHLGFYRVDYEDGGDAIFKARPEVGALGGSLLGARRRIVGGLRTADGKIVYEGLRSGFSGYMNRATLVQQAEVLDIRCTRINPTCQEILEQCLQEFGVTKTQYISCELEQHLQHEDITKLSITLSKALKEAGYVLVWDPWWELWGKEFVNWIEKNERRGTMQDTKVTVVIPNYNGIKYIHDCMDSLRRQSLKDFEILVVDNGSKDGSLEVLQEGYPEAKVIALEENTGFCHAVNLGIQESKTPYVILLNNDTIAHADFVKSLVEAIEEKEDTFSVSAMMLSMQNQEIIDGAGDNYSLLGWAYARGKGRNKKDYEKRSEVFSACGGAAIYRKTVMEEIGFFDERHFAYLEDVDIGYRARIYGYRNMYEPKAQVIHAGSATSGSRYNEFKTSLASVNNGYVIAKNMPLLLILINAPLLLIGYLIKWAFFARKKMGKLYAKGFWKGIRYGLWGEGREQRVRFRRKHFLNYVKIEIRQFVSLFGYWVKY